MEDNSNLIWNTNVFKFCISELNIILLELEYMKLETDKKNHDGINKSIELIHRKIIELKITNFN